MDTRVAHITLESCGDQYSRKYRVIEIQNSIAFEIGETLNHEELRELKEQEAIAFTIKPSRSD